MKPELALFLRGLPRIKAALKEKLISRIYYGAEFCPALLPGEKQILKLDQKLTESGKALSLVFPLLAQKALAQSQKLLNRLADKGLAAEVVINDWGLLRLFRQKLFPFQGVLGRLLTAQKTGPGILKLKTLYPDFFSAARKVPLFSPEFFKFLRESGIKRVEMENPCQGIIKEALPADFKLSLYYPEVMVSTTWRCPFRIVVKGKEETGFGGCKKLCQKIKAELSSKQMGVKLYFKGNALCYQNLNLPPDLNSLGIDRLVLAR